MLIEFMKMVALFYYWTWFIWPFVFVFSFSHGIADIIKNENSSRINLIMAAVSLVIILAGIIAPIFSL